MKMTFQLWTYDLWGDGSEVWVNDRFRVEGCITINVKREIYNKGTAHEFADYFPTDRQLNVALGLPYSTTWDGESDYTLYAKDANGNPVCELERRKEA